MSEIQETVPLVALSGVGVRRQGRWLIRDVSFAVRPGEIVSLIGPNGSGKSTSVRTALGIIRPDEGKVSARPGLSVGYMPQKLAIDRSMPLPVWRFMRLTQHLDDAAIDRALAETGAAHLRRADMQSLSGGEFQRVMLARALARNPALLVLDEPVQGIDTSGEITMYELIAEARRRTGCGVLLISHDLHVVMAATDTVVCLNGHVCCSGAPGAVQDSAAYKALFGPRGDSALALYQHHHDHEHLPGGSVTPAHVHGPGCGHDHHEDHHHAGHKHGSHGHV
ncbi:MAG: metal ABC transporter ATP-binding protein [Rhizobiaceae bacterium]